MASVAEGMATAIRNGMVDGELDLLASAIGQRRTYLAAQSALALAPGMRVRVVNEGPREHATDGATGTVREVKRTMVHVDLDRPARGSTHWRFPASALEPLG